MAGMRPTRITLDARPVGRAWAVLVLAVLGGLLAMHALAPGGKPSVGEHAATPMAASVKMADPHHLSDGHQAGSACLHSAASGGDSHKDMDHADGSCAAGKTGSGYVPPAPAPGLVVASDDANRPGGSVTAPLNSRAPPDLSELQLLRI